MVLYQLVLDKGGKCPLATVELQRTIYVDAIMSGADSLEEAIELQQQLMNLLEVALI